VRPRTIGTFVLLFGFQTVPDTTGSTDKENLDVESSTENEGLAPIGAIVGSWSGRFATLEEIVAEAVDETKRASLTSADHISTKMFRTCHVMAALEALRCADTPTIRVACQAAALVLWDTPAIARKSYVHPAILELVNTQDVKAALAGLPVWRISGLTAGEQRLMVLIG
jgi:hypothetical protein